MNSAEIKIDLFRKLDTLKGKRLEEAYGLLINFINSKNDISDWDNLSKAQKDAIKLGIKQLDNGEGKTHSEVISNMRKKFANG